MQGTAQKKTTRPDNDSGDVGEDDITCTISSMQACAQAAACALVRIKYVIRRTTKKRPNSNIQRRSSTQFECTKAERAGSIECRCISHTASIANSLRCTTAALIIISHSVHRRTGVRNAELSGCTSAAAAATAATVAYNSQPTNRLPHAMRRSCAHSKRANERTQVCKVGWRMRACLHACMHAMHARFTFARSLVVPWEGS